MLIAVLFVDGLEALLHQRLGKGGDVHLQLAHAGFGIRQVALQPGSQFGIDQTVELVRDAGEEKDRGAVVLEPDPGRRATGVDQCDGALREVRLSAVDGRHDPIHLREALFDALFDLGVAYQTAPGGSRQRFARQIVSRRSEPASHQYEVQARNHARELACDELLVVTDDHFADQRTAGTEKRFGQSQRVGVDAIGTEKLGADRQDAGLH